MSDFTADGYPSTHRQLIREFVDRELALISERSGSIVSDAKSLRRWLVDYCLTQGFEVPKVDWSPYIIEELE